MESLVVFFPCLSLEETRLFYENILGMEFYMDQGGCYLFDSGYGYLGFSENKEMVSKNHPCISFNLKDEKEVDLKYMELKDQVECTIPQKHPKFPVYSFYLKDVNGYTLEFQKILMKGKQ